MCSNGESPPIASEWGSGGYADAHGIAAPGVALSD